MESLPPHFNDYMGALFKGPERPVWTNGGILTAENPGGVTLSPEENQVRDRELKRRLENEGIPHVRMIGYSPTDPYSERGWAVACAPETLRALAADFGQLGVYEIRDGTLFLVYLSPFAEFPAGPFSERFTVFSGT